MKKPMTLATTFANYSIIKSIGQGGSGTVYSAKDDNGNNFAIKILDPKKATREKLKRFKNEYLFCSKNTHPNIITVLDHGLTQEGAPFFVMPLFENSLRALITKITFKEIIPIFSKILDGVEAAHKLGAVHRDLKPENILVNKNGLDVVIADFGIADFEADDFYTAVETKDNTRLANFQYCAPEQRARGKTVDKRSDIYALGLILNELFTFELAHGTNYKTIELVSAEYSYLDKLTEKMLQQNPLARYSDINELKLELISRSDEQVTLQKLNTLQNIVVPSTELSDPIVNDPVKIINVDWENGTLILNLNHHPNYKWISALQNIGSYSAVYGKGPDVFRFSGNNATISADKNDAQLIIDHFKDWLPMANTIYKNNVQRELDDYHQKQKDELKRKIKLEESKMQLKSSLRF